MFYCRRLFESMNYQFGGGESRLYLLLYVEKSIVVRQICKSLLKQFNKTWLQQQVCVKLWEEKIKYERFSVRKQIQSHIIQDQV